MQLLLLRKKYMEVIKSFYTLSRYVRPGVILHFIRDERETVEVQPIEFRKEF